MQKYLAILFSIWLLNIPLDNFGQSSSPYEKGPLIYENSFNSQDEVSTWTMEGPGEISFEDEWMHMQSPAEKGHHVFWCPEDFPGSFIAEWELQNQETDAGLCIIFFAATGTKGEHIFDNNLKKRDGIFSGYTKSDLNNYHISYYAHTPNAPNRPFAHLRKNTGFHKVQEGKAPIDAASKKIHKARLIKADNHIVMYIDSRKIIDWTDNGQTHGSVLEGGKIGFRQMQWTHFRYRNFKVWSLANYKSWPMYTIDNSSEGADGVKLADINADGQTDIVTGWEEGGLTKLYLNPGKNQVRTKWPSVIVGNTPKVEDAVFADMNNDGILDIVSSTENGSEKIYVHTAPKQAFLQQGQWKQSILPASDGQMMWMYAEPLQIDNRFGSDLIAAGKGENASIGWFAAPQRAGKLEKWTWHEISPVGWIMSILLRDMDGDEDIDIVISDRRGALQACRWLENPGPGPAQKGSWKSHLIGAEKLEVMFMTIGDLENDGKEEVVVCERTNQSIRIYQKQDKSGLHWKEQIIDLPEWAGTAKSIEIGDINGDLTPDLVISTNTNGQSVPGLFWLDGKRKKELSIGDFKPISGAHNAKYDKVELIDLDQDGDLDVLICEENYGEGSKGLGVIWYENKLSKLIR